MGCQCDVTRVKSFYETLRYLFQVLATPLLTDQCFHPSPILLSEKWIGKNGTFFEQKNFD